MVFIIHVECGPNEIFILLPVARNVHRIYGNYYHIDYFEPKYFTEKEEFCFSLKILYFQHSCSTQMVFKPIELQLFNSQS